MASPIFSLPIPVTTGDASVSEHQGLRGGREARPEGRPTGPCLLAKPTGIESRAWSGPMSREPTPRATRRGVAISRAERGLRIATVIRLLDLTSRQLLSLSVTRYARTAEASLDAPHRCCLYPYASQARLRLCPCGAHLCSLDPYEASLLRLKAFGQHAALLRRLKVFFSSGINQVL